ncbi:MAG: polysaccharide biosynthesis protein [Hyphomonadaceae bacterium]|nr:polysaccharide biosynthesis protein [Hyphomonadaceae bacterium]
MSDARTYAIGDQRAVAFLSQSVRLDGAFLCDAVAATSMPGLKVLGGVADVGGALDVLPAARGARLVLVGDGLAHARAIIPIVGAIGGRALKADAAGALSPLLIEDAYGQSRWMLDGALTQPVCAGRVVMITGAGGSIGAELCAQVAALGPARLVLMDNSEFNLFEIDRRMAALAPAIPRTHALCDIRDRAATQRWVERTRPDIIFHTAAYKHVPLLEDHPSEAALTNVGGAKSVFDAASRTGAHIVFVSTDKAVNPSSVMGATKRLGELYAQALDRAAGAAGPRRIVVRLGNVLGSAGSVTPIFERQIAEGGPVTVTHPDIERYFITVGQAAAFILHAAAVALDAPEERGVAYLLDMGAPVRVADLAADMIHLAGKRPHSDIPMTFIGLRPGEKLNERLLSDDERIIAMHTHGVEAALSPGVALDSIEDAIAHILSRARLGADDAVKLALLRAAQPTPDAIAAG